MSSNKNSSKTRSPQTKTPTKTTSKPIVKSIAKPAPKVTATAKATAKTSVKSPAPKATVKTAVKTKTTVASKPATKVTPKTPAKTSARVPAKAAVQPISKTKPSVGEPTAKVPSKAAPTAPAPKQKSTMPERKVKPEEKTITKPAARIQSTSKTAATKVNKSEPEVKPEKATSTKVAAKKTKVSTKSKTDDELLNDNLDNVSEVDDDLVTDDLDVEDIAIETKPEKTKGKKGKETAEESAQALEFKKAQMTLLIKSGKERGYLTYAEINDSLPDDMVEGDALDNIVSAFSDLGIQVYEQAPDAEALLMSDNVPVANADDTTEEEVEVAVSTLDSEFGRTTDPVRMYMREMGIVDLLTKAQEIEIAKRIEEGQREMMVAISACPAIIQELRDSFARIRAGEAPVDEIVDGFVGVEEAFEDEEEIEIDDDETEEEAAETLSNKQLEVLKAKAL